MFSYESATIHVHRLIREGQGDSDEADMLREQMVDTWRTLTPEQQSLLSGLSGDLYMLQKEEAFEPSSSSPQELLAHLRDAWMHQRWANVLSLLRRKEVQQAFPEDMFAHLRGRCWSSLGLNEAARCFFDFAATLAPIEDNVANLLPFMRWCAADLPMKC